MAVYLMADLEITNPDSNIPDRHSPEQLEVRIELPMRAS